MRLRILLLTPRFYGIENKIRETLQKMNFEVDWIENKTFLLDYHGTGSKLRFLRRIYFFFLFPRVRYLNRELNKLNNIRFDILLSINANVACKYLFRRIKRKNPGISTVLYLWDSSSVYSWLKEFRYFDRVITFDKADSEKFNIEYKPNFYIKENSELPSDLKYDLFFAGKYNYSRLLLLDKLTSLLKKCDVEFCMRLWPSYRIFLHNRFIYRILKSGFFSGLWTVMYVHNFEAVEGKLKRDYFVADSIGYDLIQKQSRNANVILDLPLSEQTGYTHRLIEALANGKKVITPNKNICKEPFFNPDQIHNIDLMNPVVDIKWIKERSSFPVDSYISGLELSSWLISVLDVKAA